MDSDPIAGAPSLLSCYIIYVMDINQHFKDSNIGVFCRDGSDWLLQQLDNCQVPLLVFSAGIGDIIEEVFRQRSKMYDNIKIVSNFMHFNQEVGSKKIYQIL